MDIVFHEVHPALPDNIGLFAQRLGLLLQGRLFCARFTLPGCERRRPLFLLGGPGIQAVTLRREFAKAVVGTRAYRTEPPATGDHPIEVGQDEQEKRFKARIEDPLRQWKLSPMDIKSYDRWYEYSRARDMMLEMTDSKEAPWFIVRSDDKRRARLNCISHILSQIPAKKVTRPKVKLPKRSMKAAYDDQATLEGRRFVAEKY